MEIRRVLLLLLNFVLAHGASVRYEMNLLENKSGHGPVDIQVTKPSESTSGRSVQEDIKIAQMKYQANRMENSEHRDDSKLSQRSSVQTPVMHHQDRYATRSPNVQDQTFSMDPNYFQGQTPITPSTISTVQPQTNDQFNDFTSQQQFFTEGPQQVTQQQFYQDRRVVDIENQRINTEMHYKDISNQERQMQGDVRSSEFQGRNAPQTQMNAFESNRGGQQSTHQIRAFDNSRVVPQVPHQMSAFDNTRNVGQGIQQYSAFEDNHRDMPQDSHQLSAVDNVRIIPEAPVKLSAFDNREQPLTLPALSQSHSSSVVVSGLKNLPVLPAMVYNAGIAPAARTLTYGRDSWYQGGASVRQHLQTPYVRYVYSHLL